MFDSGMEFDYVSAGNNFVEDRQGLLLPSFLYTFRVTTPDGWLKAGLAKAFNQRLHARQAQGFDQFEGRRFMGVG
jgi:hypothetical protein